MFVCVRDRKVDTVGTNRGKPRFGLTRNFKEDIAVLSHGNLYLLPTDFAAPSGFQRLQKCLLCSKAPGVGLMRRFTLCLAILPFGRRKYARRKTRSSG